MEIGSIFEIDLADLFREPLPDAGMFPFSKRAAFHMAYFHTGRAAIEAVLTHIRQTGRKRIWLPAFCCSSVKDAAVRSGMQIQLYEVRSDLQVTAETLCALPVQDEDVFYYVHFFGLFPSNEVMEQIHLLQQRGVTVFEDITLNIFSDHETKIGFGTYIVGSIRKWLPLPDGAFIASREPLPEFRREPAANEYVMNYFTAQLMKGHYIKDPRCDKSVFLGYSGRGMEALFDDYTVRHMSEVSGRLMRATDFHAVIQKRVENYDALYDRLCHNPHVSPLVKREPGAVPMGMIVTARERDALFTHLVRNGVYCNIHWRPNDMSDSCEGARYLAQHCLTIPCDQRYGAEQIDYIYRQIMAFGVNQNV